MRLGDICTKIGSGATPRGGQESYKSSGIPIIRSQNVLDWSFKDDALAYIDVMWLANPRHA
jgi:type I restriction enzyme S subunit